MVLFNNKKNCCGCSACANICPQKAITMVPDYEGFEYPVTEEQICTQCGLCLKVCPVKAKLKEAEKENQKEHIGIINLQFTPNYGAVIAAAVLEDVVNSLTQSQYIVKTVNYAPNKDYDSFLHKVFDHAKQWGSWKLYFKSFFPKTAIGADKTKREGRFKLFKDNFLNLTPLYEDAFDINKEVKYSAFITGSDIVWAPKKSDNFRADGYYLKFANKGELKIAYAPSIDTVVNKKLKSLSECYQNNIKDLDFISVREKSNVKFIQSLTDKRVFNCCDPAFLVEPDYYNKMIETADISQTDDRYLYVYILEENQKIVDYANSLAKDKSLKICYYSPNHNNFVGQAEDCTADGPAEFLHRIKNAEYVLTNSFHCVVFSLLFKKKFLSFIRSSTSIKSIDLLDDFNLKSRIATNNSNIDDSIDFDEVDKKLLEIRESSLNYLRSALGKLK